MPIIKSAKKRARTADKATVRNRRTKRSLKSAIKAFQASLTGNKKDSPRLQSEAQSAIDTAVKKGVLHKNKGARKKSQLVKQAKEAGVKPATKAVAKKTTSKAAAKPATKKTPTKKSTDKKVTDKK